MTKREVDRYIQLWLTGDELAFKKILDYYYRRLLASALKTVVSREDAEELVMNALLKIWQHKNRLSEVRQFDDYLFGILRRETAALLRKQVMQTENIDGLPLSELGSTVHPEFTIKEIQSLYRAALQKLTPKQREIFLSIRERDISRKEIAEKNGMSIHTVNNHMNAALKVIRQEMKEYPDALIGILLASSPILPLL